MLFLWRLEYIITSIGSLAAGMIKNKKGAK